jgi:hypothetical protein
LRLSAASFPSTIGLSLTTNPLGYIDGRNVASRLCRVPVRPLTKNRSKLDIGHRLLRKQPAGQSIHESASLKCEHHVGLRALARDQQQDLVLGVRQGIGEIADIVDGLAIGLHDEVTSLQTCE